MRMGVDGDGEICDESIAPSRQCFFFHVCCPEPGSMATPHFQLPSTVGGVTTAVTPNSGWKLSTAGATFCPVRISLHPHTSEPTPACAYYLYLHALKRKTSV
ncbi:hypothetical protein B5807_02945 [Epicoccum nigrum]|uniref:Uncharacterized protein n=1 Tax=Epicoccum nigrum TaxID=105696 RepID=A0A1Y2MAR4_EPING|nr:hypothetical protein B5807_02945 [Epicoccum nigrum]